MNSSSDPRWLTPEQLQAWIPLMQMTASLPTALDAQLHQDAGITHVEYGVLSWLSMQPDRTARMSDVAALANVSLSHLSRIAARLEKRGWMRRTPDPADGRATLAVLTEQGWDKVQATAPGHAEEAQRLVFDHLTATEVRYLQRIAEKVAAAAKSASCAPRSQDATT